MIISRAEIASALSAYKTVKRKQINGAAHVDSADSFEPTDTAASLGAFRSAATSEPFYRPELVDHLRYQISEGRYFVPTEEIVEKLLGRLLVAAAY